MLYLTLLSLNGGTIKIRALFANSQGGFGHPDLGTGDMQKFKKKKTLADTEMTADEVVEGLNNWHDKNKHLLDYYKYMLHEGGPNFMDMNKFERLEKLSYHNLAAEHQNKMWINKLKREAAHNKAMWITAQNWENNRKNLTKWEDYRETRIELISILIKVLKRKNFTRRWLLACKQGQVYAKIRANLYIRRHLNHILFTSIRVAMRFKNTYLFRYQRQYGFDMTRRRQNELRRALNFGAQAKYATIIRDVKQRLASFVFKTFLIFNTCQQFTYFNDNLLHVQCEYRNILATRECKFWMVYKRMELLKDALLAMYGKKPKSKKPYAGKLKPALKKVFNRERSEDLKKVREQIGLWGDRNMQECQNYFDSIQIRYLTMVHQILATGKLKNEEGVKVLKEDVEKIKTEVEALLKRVRIRTKKIETAERDIWGIPADEIKDNAKRAKFEKTRRKPDQKVLALAALHKYDPAQIIKSDKIMPKYAKTHVLKAYKKPKKAPAAPKKKKKAASGEGGEGGPAEEGAGAEGEGAGEGAEGEGQEGAGGGDMEGMEGEEGAEGMEGEEGGMDGEGEEGMDGEAGEGGEGGDGEDGGEKEADGDGEGGEGDENQEGADGQLTKNASAASLGKDGEGGDQGDGAGGDPGSPSKKKRSVSKGKKPKKVVDEDNIEIIKQKESAKVKAKWLVDEKIDNPPEIMEYIDELYPEIEQEDGAKIGGVDRMESAVAEVKKLVYERYRMPEKKKLQRMLEKQKMNFQWTPMLRFMLHICLNIGP